jgi:hypothetical protein
MAAKCDSLSVITLVGCSFLFVLGFLWLGLLAIGHGVGVTPVICMLFSWAGIPLVGRVAQVSRERGLGVRFVLILTVMLSGFPFLLLGALVLKCERCCAQAQHVAVPTHLDC